MCIFFGTASASPGFFLLLLLAQLLLRHLVNALLRSEGRLPLRPLALVARRNLRGRLSADRRLQLARRRVAVRFLEGIEGRDDPRRVPPVASSSASAAVLLGLVDDADAVALEGELREGGPAVVHKVGLAHPA